MNIKFLRELAYKTIQDCTFCKQVQIGTDLCTLDVLLPSGDEKYSSFWVRDAAMMAESLLISPVLLKKYIELIASQGQNGSRWFI